MANVTKPVLLDETGKLMIQAIEGLKSSIDDGSLAVHGKDGVSAGFGTPTVTVINDDSGAEPSATVTASGDDSAKVFAFELRNFKGEKGDGANLEAGEGISIQKGSDKSTISLDEDTQSKLNKIDSIESAVKEIVLTDSATSKKYKLGVTNGQLGITLVEE